MSEYTIRTFDDRISNCECCGCCVPLKEQTIYYDTSVEKKLLCEICSDDGLNLMRYMVEHRYSSIDDFELDTKDIVALAHLILEKYRS